MSEYVGPGEERRDDGEILRHVVGDRERGQRTSSDQQLLANFHDVDQLRRVGVEVHHVARLFGRGGPRVHGDADVGLGESGRIIGAVTRHGDEFSALLLLLDERHLRFRCGFGEEVVDTGLLGDGRGGQRIVTGDHHGADAHLAHLGELLADSLLHNVLQFDDAQDVGAVGDDERCRAGARRALHDLIEIGRRGPAGFHDPALNGVGGSLSDLARTDVESGHTRRRGEGDEDVVGPQLTLADSELLFREHHDRATFGGLVGE